MKHPLILLTCLSLFFFSCVEKKSSPEEESKPGIVKLSGTSKYPEKIERIAVYRWQLYYDSNFEREKFHGIENEDGLYEIEIFCDKYLNINMSSVNSPMQNLFLTAGDSLTFVADTIPNPNSYWGRDIVFTFSGDNAAHYNYDYLSRLAVPFKRPKAEEDIVAYKEALMKYRDDKQAFLEEYRKEHTVSKAFYDYAKSEIINDYLTGIYAPILYEKVSEEDVPKGYLDDGLKPTNDRTSSYQYAMHAKYIYPYTHNFTDNFDEMQKRIVKKFKGEERDFLYATMLDLYIGRVGKPNEVITEMFTEAHEVVQTSRYLKMIEQLSEHYQPDVTPIPQDVQEQTKLQAYEDGKTYTLEEVLKKYQGKAVYIDFWASWCGPCLYDIENSAEAKKLLTEKGIAYVYFATDSKEENWSKAVKENKIELDQYLLLEDDMDSLIDYFEVNGIPRYILLDTDHQIMNSKAPRPVPNGLDELKKEIASIKEPVTVFTY